MDKELEQFKKDILSEIASLNQMIQKALEKPPEPLPSKDDEILKELASLKETLEKDKLEEKGPKPGDYPNDELVNVIIPGLIDKYGFIHESHPKKLKEVLQLHEGNEILSFDINLTFNPSSEITRLVYHSSNPSPMLPGSNEDHTLINKTYSYKELKEQIEDITERFLALNNEKKQFSPIIEYFARRYGYQILTKPNNIQKEYEDGGYSCKITEEWSIAKSGFMINMKDVINTGLNESKRLFAVSKVEYNGRLTGTWDDRRKFLSEPEPSDVFKLLVDMDKPLS